jgi:tRNA splicing endonuclease
LDVVRRVGRPLSKAEILLSAAIPEERWPQAIRRLVGTGALVQEGLKRGTRYRVASD